MGIKIPKEAVEAFRAKMGMYETFNPLIEGALIAAINAWPGAFPHTFTGPLEGHGYVLPLTQKNGDSNDASTIVA